MGANGITSLLDICGRALSVQSQAIRVIGNNVANANTVGYSRREVEMQAVASSEGKTYGEGVEIRGVVRKVDQFLLEELQRRNNDVSRLEARDELLGRIETLFTVSGDQKTIGTELTEFFNALEDLKTDPASIPFRSNVVNAGDSLASTIRTTYNFIADAQREADSRIGMTVTAVNALTTQIADINRQIAASETQEQQNLALRDKRDSLLDQLSEKISFSLVESNDGTVNVSLANGFGLVTGATSRALEFTSTPSYSDAAMDRMRALDGGKLGYIVYNYNTSGVGTASHVDFTSVVANGGGELAGLLTMRGVQHQWDQSAFDADGDLVEVASRIEAIARDLLSRFNSAYTGPDGNTSNGAVFDPGAMDLNGGNPGALGLFGLDNVPAATLDTAVIIGKIDAAEISDENVLHGLNIGSYASRLNFAVDSPSDFAAGWDQDTATVAENLAPGDARNIDALLALKDAAVDFDSYGFTSIGIMPLETLYTDTVGVVGSMKSTTESQVQTARDRQTQMREFQAAISGVNMDEELANLINFQRAFQASSRMIKTADELLNEIINLIG